MLSHPLQPFACFNFFFGNFSVLVLMTFFAYAAAISFAARVLFEDSCFHHNRPADRRPLPDLCHTCPSVSASRLPIHRGKFGHAPSLPKHTWRLASVQKIVPRGCSFLPLDVHAVISTPKNGKNYKNMGTIFFTPFKFKRNTRGVTIPPAR